MSQQQAPLPLEVEEKLKVYRALQAGKYKYIQININVCIYKRMISFDIAVDVI
jgi:hypothetical protein